MRRRHDRLLEVLEGQKDAAATRVAVGAAELRDAFESTMRLQESAKAYSMNRYEVMRKGVGSWAWREGIAVESSQELGRRRLEAQGAIQNLAKARARMMDSSAALARSIALIRAARRRGE